MRKTIALLKAGFESSCGETEEFREFFSVFKREFTKELKSVGAEKIEFRKGHFYVSGFYTIGAQVWYFNVGDVRDGTSPAIVYRAMMYRKAKDYTDFTGETNHWIAIHTNMARTMHG